METENEIIVVLLHDEQLPYEDYIERINGNQLARRVKLVDLAHNSNESCNCYPKNGPFLDK